MSALPLPPALAPWAPWLDLFPAELALSLGPMIQRLAAAIGPFAIPAQSGHGEPDGFGGLDRRGVYERLLASEWLLAELAPDEFLRRAAASEHAFLRLERREPALARTSVVLFDAGPAQLGGPRLAHLAALVAFARRAAAARASLVWGLLQEPGVPLVGEVTRATVRALLARRTPVAVAGMHAAAWRESLKGHVSQDIWLIGGASVGDHAWPGVATVALSEPLQLGPPALAAALRTVTGRRVDVSLPLPAGPDAVRLIRDPFPPDAPAKPAGPRRRTRRVPATNLLITPYGERVFAGAKGGGVIVYPVPHQSHGGVGKPKLHFAELPRPPAAVGWYNRGSAAAVVSGDRLTLLRKTHRSSSGPEALHYPYSPETTPAAGEELRMLRFRGNCTYFHDAHERLFELGYSSDKSPYCHAIDTRTIAVAECSDWLARVSISFYAEDDDAIMQILWSIVVTRGHRPPQRFMLGLPEPLGAHFTRASSGDWHCAVSQEPGRWKLHGEADTDIEWLTGDPVIGLLGAHHLSGIGKQGPALVTLVSGRDFMANQGGTTWHITTAEEPVVHAALATASGHLAYVTARGTVVVLRPPYDAPLARFFVEDP